MQNYCFKCVIFIQLFALFIGISTAQTNISDSSSNTFNISTSPGWRAVARLLRQSIDFTADPCKDFFKFACGTWNKLNPIPDSKDRHDAFTIVRDRVKESIKTIFESEEVKNHSSKALRLAKTVYDSCIENQATKVNETHSLWQMIMDLGGWPLFEFLNWNESEFNMELVIGKLWRKNSLPSLISPYVSADKMNASAYILYLDQAYLAFGLKSEDYYLGDRSDYVEVRDAYRKLIQNSVLLFLNDTNREPKLNEFMKQQINDILNFEITLAELNTPVSLRRDETALYHKFRFGQLYELTNSFDWLMFVKGLDLVEYLTLNTSVIVTDPTYIIRLTKTLSITPKRTIANYLIWRLVFDQMIFLDQRYRDQLYTFVNMMKGALEPTRSDFCIAYMTGEPDDHRQFLGYAVGRVFVENYFPEESKIQLSEMINNIINAFDSLIDKMQWMDDTTKQSAKAKAKGIHASVGYPDFILNDKQLDAFYSGLILNEHDLHEEDASTNKILKSDSFYVIHNKLIRWIMEKQIAKLSKRFERKSFGGSPATVNAWYSSLKNSIVFPAGIVQPPFFDPSFPKAVNYGAMGSVIGHEIIHAFDDQGAQYDRHGNLINWWSTESKEKFKEKTKCIVNQYSKFCYTYHGNKMCLKGEHTQGENIADNGGLKEAFAGYKKYVEEHGQEPRLPSLEQYSMEQVFFMSFASFWCGQYKEKHLVNLLAVSEHSPGEFRVIGSLQNSEDFNRAFNCSVGAPMNPKHKCIVW
ncbi:Neprilysin-2 [Trichinella sp. T9]|nr:Neprilysin-2 [Trichinella sp. T9]